MRSDVRIVHNKLLGGWFIVRGSHDTPISGRFDSKAQAQAHLQRKSQFDSRGTLPVLSSTSSATRYYIASGVNLPRITPLYWTRSGAWSRDVGTRWDMSYADALREAQGLVDRKSIHRFSIYPVEVKS